MPAKQYCTFYAAGMWLGVPAIEVREVLTSIEITPLPLSPPYVMGLINVRGEVILVVDLVKRIAGDEELLYNTTSHIIMETRGWPISMMVGSPGEVIWVEEEEIHPPPASLNRLSRELIKGAVFKSESIMLILDSERASTIVVKG